MTPPEPLLLPSVCPEQAGHGKLLVGRPKGHGPQACGTLPTGTPVCLSAFSAPSPAADARWMLTEVQAKAPRCSEAAMGRVGGEPSSGSQEEPTSRQGSVVSPPRAKGRSRRISPPPKLRNSRGGKTCVERKPMTCAFEEHKPGARCRISCEPPSPQTCLLFSQSPPQPQRLPVGHPRFLPGQPCDQTAAGSQCLPRNDSLGDQKPLL